MSTNNMAVKNVSKVLPWALALSIAGTVFIQTFEGTELNAYNDVGNVLTICTGSTKNVFIGQKATLKECEARLQEDATYAGDAIKKYTYVRLSQDQYDALVSFVFNVGPNAYRKSTLLKKLNAGECLAAAKEFLRWDKVQGQKVRGLSRRRQAEKALFEKDCE